jgi:hypothetical protein
MITPITCELTVGKTGTCKNPFNSFREFIRPEFDTPFQAADKKWHAGCLTSNGHYA